MEIIACSGYDDDELEAWRGFGLVDDVPFARAIASGEPVWALSAEEMAVFTGVQEPRSAGWVTIPLAGLEGARGAAAPLAAQAAHAGPGRARMAAGRWCSSAARLSSGARLYEQEQRSRRRAERVQSTTASLSNALTSTDVARVVAVEVAKAIEADAVGVVARTETGRTNGVLAVGGSRRGTAVRTARRRRDGESAGRRSVRARRSVLRVVRGRRRGIPRRRGGLRPHRVRVLPVRAVRGRPPDERAAARLLAQQPRALARTTARSSRSSWPRERRHSTARATSSRSRRSPRRSSAACSRPRSRASRAWTGSSVPPRAPPARRRWRLVRRAEPPGRQARARRRRRRREGCAGRREHGAAAKRDQGLLGGAAQALLGAHTAQPPRRGRTRHDVRDGRIPRARPRDRSCRMASAGHRRQSSPSRTDGWSSSRAPAGLPRHGDRGEVPATDHRASGRRDRGPYTDGLVERRGRSIDEGLDDLREAVARAPKDPDRLLEHVLAHVVPGDVRGDDIVLLAARVSLSPRASSTCASPPRSIRWSSCATRCEPG